MDQGEEKTVTISQQMMYAALPPVTCRTSPWLEQQPMVIAGFITELQAFRLHRLLFLDVYFSF